MIPINIWSNSGGSGFSPGPWLFQQDQIQRPAGNDIRPGRDHGPITIAQRAALQMTAG
jgi:hypothetical protein